MTYGILLYGEVNDAREQEVKELTQAMLTSANLAELRRRADAILRKHGSDDDLVTLGDTIDALAEYFFINMATTA